MKINNFISITPKGLMGTETLDMFLFILECRSREPRSMLCPVNEFLSARRDDYEVLKKHSEKDVTCAEVDGVWKNTGDTLYRIDNILYKTYDDGQLVREEHTDFCCNLMDYADGLYGYYHDMKDKTWYDQSICHISKDFDVIKAYINCREMKQIKSQAINIVEGWLILETDEIFGG